MKIIRSEAYIELSAEEVSRFDDPTFRETVLHAARELSYETGLTVIVAGPDDELGIFNEYKGWRASEPRPTTND